MCRPGFEAEYSTVELATRSLNQFVSAPFTKIASSFRKMQESGEIFFGLIAIALTYRRVAVRLTVVVKESLGVN